MAEQHPRAIEEAARYRAYLFGARRVYSDGELVGPMWLARNRAWEILLWFLLNPRQPCLAEVLVENLWPGEDSAKSVASFHVCMHVLRRALEPDLPRGGDSVFLRRHDGKLYSFNPRDQWWTDADEIERLDRLGQTCELDGDIPRAKYYYRRVAGYVAQGPLLATDTFAWVETYRSKYRQLCQRSLTRLMVLESESGAEEELLEAAYVSLMADPRNQLATEILVLNSIARGDYGAARSRLHAFSRAAEGELSMDVPREFTELYSALADPDRCEEQVDRLRSTRQRRLLQVS